MRVQPIIQLNAEETRLAVEEGRAAVERVKAMNLKDYTVEIDTLKAHQMGCAAEIAVCNYLGVQWGKHGMDGRFRGDASLCEVRCIRNVYRQHLLLLNERDLQKLHRPYVHVVSLGNQQFKLSGWAYGHEVVRDENIFNHAKFVEKIWRLQVESLRCITELKQLFEEGELWKESSPI